MLALPPISSTPEPKVSNREYLDSLVNFGCWLRVIAANENRAVLSNTTSTTLECYSAIASFYQQVGMFVEDILSGLVCWPVWSKDESVHLPTLMSGWSCRKARSRTGRGKSCHGSPKTVTRQSPGRFQEKSRKQRHF